MNLDNIDDDMLDTIADLVLDKLLYKMKNEVHAKTPMSINDIINGFMPFKETDEEFLISELARLMTLLTMYEEKEQYRKAAIIKNKLEIIQNKLDNL
tara:strand:- start:68 stop:358 length:291 start_codon:yes stop_codon:yes gene_type:complete